MKPTVKTLIFSAILGIFVVSSSFATDRQGEVSKTFNMVSLVENNAKSAECLAESQELALAQMAKDLTSDMEQNAVLEMYEPSSFMKKAAFSIVETSERNALADANTHLEEELIAKAIVSMVEENAAADAE
ncbi:MAG: hypothetical protein EAZ57_07605 [Cytophagales bacterium]|nr:MAG: hypothetical protein EAZ67_08690 [Cytophagales bacterium]TAF60403.1 MAG: hypothetical protein EAZ57_07605 [Cytophagales bacterium]